MIVFRLRALVPLLLSILIAMMLSLALRGPRALAATASPDQPASTAAGHPAGPAPGHSGAASDRSGAAPDHPAGAASQSRSDAESSGDARNPADDDDDRADGGGKDGVTDHDADDASGWDAGDHPRRGHHHRDDDSVVNIGSNSELRAGEEADSVVAIFGSSTSAGVADDVGAIFGNTHVTGPVKDSVFAIFGNAYVDSPVGEDVVAVFGNVELGPNADIRGDVSSVFGGVTRDPSALVRGDVNSVGGRFGGIGWLQPWIDHCFLYGRPLALVSGIGWAWGLALGFLALYACLALLFPGGVSRCVATLENEPGMSLAAALLTLLLLPITIVLLCITVVGIAAIPFLLFGLFCMGLFGKAVMLAWIGRRCLSVRGPGAAVHGVLAVLVGGIVVLALYLVPVVGFIVYKVLGVVGLGVVVYTLVSAARAHQREAAAGRHAGTSGAAAGAAAGTFAAAPGPAVGAYTTPPGPDGMAGAAQGPVPGAAPSAQGAGPGASGGMPGAAPGAYPGDGASATRTAARAAVSSALPRAGFWIRMAALVIDALLVGILLGAVHHHGDFFLVVLAIYGAIMWKLRGSTVGGIVFDLQVVRLDERPIGWETAIVRALGCFLSLVVVGLGFFWIAFDHGKQAWHDKIAGTVVVRVPKGGISLV
jgi:uncharacterized RDD family membrane protein YckC